MQNNEYSKFATPIKSAGRIYKEKASSLRSPYQRDRDRIIHSTAFRRLKHKTQVFVNTTGDHYRTRITHSLEVSQIARTLGKIFKLNEDLCETLSLAHDLGHPPFAHAGEESLNECMDDFGGFDHNIQTLRIITLLERKYYNFKGLNLSIETLDGLIKHNGPVFDKFKYDKILGKKIFKKKINFLNKPSLESQISSISDDIAYNSHDLEDGLKAGLFKIEELNDIPIISDIIYKHKKKLKKKEKELVLRQIVRDTINEMVKDVIINIRKSIKYENPKNINDIYKAKIKLVNFSDKMINFDLAIKFFLKRNMYFHKSVLNKTNRGKKIIKTLFSKIKKNPKKFIKKEIFYKKSKERNICDFIAGMTDRYAINLYNSIK
jgi:dGTPase